MSKPEDQTVTAAIRRLVASSRGKGNGQLGDFGLTLDEPVFLRLCQEQGRASEMVVVATPYGRTVVTCKGGT